MGTPGITPSPESVLLVSGLAVAVMTSEKSFLPWVPNHPVVPLRGSPQQLLEPTAPCHLPEASGSPRLRSRVFSVLPLGQPQGTPPESLQGAPGGQEGPGCELLYPGAGVG